MNPSKKPRMREEDANMVINIEDDFSLDAIADSGQCFRWHLNSDGSYYIISKGKLLKAQQDKHSKSIHLDCSEEDFRCFWNEYFDLDTSYQKIRAIVPPSDGFLFSAAQQETGIRILHQDVWEMLITFIISQRKSIPAIKKAVEAVCERSGEPLVLQDGTKMYSFPTPEALSNLSLEDLKQCGLGYRSRYVYEVAQTIAHNAFNLQAIEKFDDDTLFKLLQTLTGVGKKVANCVMLFGYHRLNAFPQDVWINRILDDKYPNGFSFDAYKPYNGVMQQYMFEYYRRTSK